MHKSKCWHRCTAGSLAAPENEVGHSLRGVDLSENFTARAVAVDAVLLRITPTYAEPDVAIDIDANAIGGDLLGKLLAVGQLAGPHIHVKNADRPCLAIDDVEELLVVREAQSIRLLKIISHDRDVAALPVHSVDVVARPLLFRLDTFVIAENPVAGISEPN
jgi:hypothetical protein